MEMSQQANVVLEAKNLQLCYDAAVILPDMNLSIHTGQITALVGTNGSGKSTLLKAFARLLKPDQGNVYLDGRAIATLSSSEVARRMAILPQSPDVPSSLTVHELVEQGRYPHAGPLKMLRKQDHAAIDRALALTGMSDYRNRLLDSLSGGERQRAWIALALAQSTSVLLLDEPTTYLDIRHQLEIMELVQRLNHEEGMTVIIVLHDLNQAAQLADRMIVLQQGRVAGDGRPETVMTASMLETVFGIHARVVEDPEGGRPYFIPLSVARDPKATGL
ncbi:ABC transporter ATP-binding protein [Paenibacillus senegalensis]|uniref:ABC transporter ATP-binding protein n=1 Tax=Paenibacillus senegalensis TaxID=1465766 RepID=UPI000289E9C5|nr:ABC transporter ATP-binding protein [Paenibacillus senegalensis]